MNKDDVIRMALRTGCLNVADYGRKSYEFQPNELERFAAIIAAAEREACIENARTVGGNAGAEMEKLIRARGQK